MLILAVAANIVMLIVLYLIVKDAYRNEGGLIALLAFLIPLYALYYLFFKMGEQKKTAITLWCFGLVLSFIPYLPPVQRALHRDDVCTLLKPEDITRELGWGVAGMQTGRQGGACRYALESNPPNTLIFRMGGCDPSTIAAIRDKDQAFPVSEVGDEAAAVGRELWVRQGDQCYVVYLEKASPQDDTLQGRKHLVAKVIEQRGRR